MAKAKSKTSVKNTPKNKPAKAASKQHSAPKSAKAPKVEAKKAAKDSDKELKNKKAAALAGKSAEKQSNASKEKVAAKPAKKAGKADTKAKGRGKKADEDDLDDAFLDGDVDGSDIEEYAEELEAVEEMDEEPAKEEELVASDDAKVPGEDEEIFLTDAEGNRYCRAKDCDQISIVEGYCRYHYLLFWKKIQVRKKILTDGKLERYVEELTSRYPDKFLEIIRKDLRSQKDFQAAIHELEIDDSGVDNEFEEDTQSYIDEVRGISEHTSSMDEDEF